MNIIDVTIFSGEEKTLLLRLTEHNDLVSEFIITECSLSFTNIRKELVLPKLLNKDEFKQFKNKIIPIYITEYQNDLVTNWGRENYVRNFSINYIKSNKNYKSNDLFIISDLDEIININEMRKYINNKIIVEPIKIKMTMHYYNIKYVKKYIWTYAFICNLEYFNKFNNFNVIRTQINNKLTNNICGWHLSFFMTVDEISNKLSNFSHSEYNTSYFNDKKRIQNCVDNNLDLFDRKGEEQIIYNGKIPKFINLLK